MKSKLLCILLCLFFCTESFSKCNGKFVNPITDVCWSCIFPITICGMRVSPKGEDTPNPKSLICTCGAPIPRFGIPISFWEPVRLVDVTRRKFCLVNMGGINVGGDSVKGHGTVNSGKSGGRKNSFYQVHYYMYPLLFWLELLTNFVCMETGQCDLTYITEFDPFWNDDETSIVLNPEAILFANPVAQAACATDAVSSTIGFPLDAMFWCSGSQGSIYPFTGNIADHISGIQASLLSVSRFLSKLHREALAWGTIGPAGMCNPYPMPIIIKSQYKQQLTYPVSTTGKGGCKPIGRSDLLWSSGKERPYVGEDFGYLIWRKRQCCLL